MSSSPNMLLCAPPFCVMVALLQFPYLTDVGFPPPDSHTQRLAFPSVYTQITFLNH